MKGGTLQQLKIKVCIAYHPFLHILLQCVFYFTKKNPPSYRNSKGDISYLYVD